MPRISKKIKKEMVDVRQQVREKTAGYIVTALGLVAGLAWNDTIKSFIEYFFPPNKTSSLWAKLIYSIVLTLVIVFISFYVMKFLKGETVKAEKEIDDKPETKSKTEAK